MLIKGHPLLMQSSLWELKKFCSISTLDYFENLLTISFHLWAVALAMEGGTLKEHEKSNFKINLEMVHEIYERKCTDELGIYEKSN